jgi:N-methylhydantoinase A
LALFAFGGGGPVHAAALAEELGMRRVLVPRYPGVTSALGLLLSDVRYDLVRTWVRRLRGVGDDELMRLMSGLAEEARQFMGRAGFDHSGVDLEFEADMRYRGQAYELTVPVRRQPAGSTVEAAAAEFHEAHEHAYGHRLEAREVELVALRLRASGRTGPRPQVSEPGGPAESKPTGARIVRSEAGPVRYALHDRASSAGAVSGPALVEQADTTVVVPPGWRLIPSGANVAVMERVR